MAATVGESSATPTAVMLVAGARFEALQREIEATGRRVLEGAPVTEAAARFAADRPQLCVINSEGLAADALDALIGAATRGRAGVVFIAPPEDPALETLVAIGATHWLPAPAPPGSLARMLALAERHAARATVRQERRQPRPTDTSELSEAALRERVSARLSGGAAPFALLLGAFARVDVVNMTFGREVGDAMLDAVVERIAPLVEAAGGTIARQAGTRFAAIVPGGGREGEALAAAIVAAVQRPVLAGHQLVSVGCRIGVVEARPGDEAPALLRRAAAALAEAQASEVTPVRMLQAGEERATMLDAALHADLRGALDRDEIEILFQPQVSIANGRVAGVEALARWRHPVHGELGATTLFSVADQSDYLHALSLHIQRKALCEVAGWPAALAHLRLAVNITPADLAQDGFVAAFGELVATADLTPRRVTVEITESGVMADLAAAAEALAALRHAGFRIAIDDFGTGYSSLAWLKALPLDYLKIDKALAQDIGGTGRDRIVVRGVIDMARSLGLAVIAEGVETVEQLALLAAEGCNYYQGFLFSGPVTTTELKRVIEAG